MKKYVWQKTDFYFNIEAYKKAIEFYATASYDEVFNFIQCTKEQVYDWPEVAPDLKDMMLKASKSAQNTQHVLDAFEILM